MLSDILETVSVFTLPLVEIGANQKTCYFYRSNEFIDDFAAVDMSFVIRKCYVVRKLVCS